MTSRNNSRPKDRLERRTMAEEEQIIRDSLTAISTQHKLQKISAKDEESIQQVLSRFDSLKHYHKVFLFNGLKLVDGNKPSFLTILSVNSIVELSSRHEIRRESLTELEFVGLVNLTKDYGHTYIRPETIADKLNELFKSTEVDFDLDKTFSRNYFVLTSDEQQLRKQVTQEFLAVFNNYKGLEVEICNQVLMVRLRQRATIHSAEVITGFLSEINTGRN